MKDRDKKDRSGVKQIIECLILTMETQTRLMLQKFPLSYKWLKMKMFEEVNFDISDSLSNSQLNDSPPTKATQMSDAHYHQFSKDENMTEQQKN